MADLKKTSNKKTNTTKKTTTTNIAESKKTAEKNIQNVETTETVPVTTQTVKEPTVKARRVKVDLPLNYEVDVINGFHGKLTYVGKNSGAFVEWEEFGDRQVLDLKELKNAFASQKKFFKENWWLFDDPDVIEFLRAEEFYKNALNSDGFDDIFTKTPDEIADIVSNMSRGQRKSLAYRTIEMINSGELDSRKTIMALKEALGFELVEE